MSFYNVFKDKGIINVIPLFTALYLAFNTQLRLIPILLGANVVIFYLIVTLLAKKIIEKGDNKKRLEDNVFDELLNEKYKIPNAFLSFGNWILLLVTTIILYQYRDDFVTFLLFWFLIIGFVYNLLSLFIMQSKRLKEAFNPKNI